jgi:uncharacterized DUF497 family protein
MEISFDPSKRDWTLAERNLDFADAAVVFQGHTYDWVDDRFDYGGYLRHRMVVVVWTERGDARHVISMRKANAREQARHGAYLARPG